MVVILLSLGRDDAWDPESYGNIGSIQTRRTRRTGDFKIIRFSCSLDGIDIYVDEPPIHWKRDSSLSDVITTICGALGAVCYTESKVKARKLRIPIPDILPMSCLPTWSGCLIIRRSNDTWD